MSLKKHGYGYIGRGRGNFTVTHACSSRSKAMKQIVICLTGSKKTRKEIEIILDRLIERYKIIWLSEGMCLKQYCDSAIYALLTSVQGDQSGTQCPDR